MTLQLYSTLGREKRPFRPLVDGEVRIYVCGVTPYDVTHLGHAFSYVQFDTLRRYLDWNGMRVLYVQNVTDIDDDMIMVSRRQGGRPIAEIRDENDAIFRADLDRLNVLRPTVYPFATDHIPEIIETTRRILDAGYGYAVDGDVFFDVATYPKYGGLNGVALDELEKRENPEAKHREKRRGPLDFLLWQTVDPGDPVWDSPWGPGRPGWSIECTAMSMTHLGEQIDIHGGGSDLVFPHHENEIAQAETSSGAVPFCGWWMHNGMLQLDGVKMSKSLGNLVLARELMRRIEPDHLRLYLLSEHYRTDADYRDGAIEALAGRHERLRTIARSAATDRAPDAHPLVQQFRERMDDDLDVPGSLDILDAAATRVLGGTSEAGEAEAIRTALNTLGFSYAAARGPALGDFDP
jgi:L-cysteine:1D-myo-inositol 2-amino-2-deoxy-alpha-D-glucopyranoside ligase